MIREFSMLPFSKCIEGTTLYWSTEEIFKYYPLINLSVHLFYCYKLWKSLYTINRLNCIRSVTYKKRHRDSMTKFFFAIILFFSIFLTAKAVPNDIPPIIKECEVDKDCHELVLKLGTEFLNHFKERLRCLGGDCHISNLY
jgi:hypothetical protein